MASVNLKVRRQNRVRYKLKNTKSKRNFRLSVFRSNQHIYAQVIDDANNTTVAYASTTDKELKSLKNGSNKAAAEQVGILVAKRAVAAKVKDVIFDRGRFLYHGRIKALGDAARQNGLNF